MPEPAASTLRALTVKQPWAHMITHCGKMPENRGYPPPRWLTEVAIHAGAPSGWDEDAEFSPLVREAWAAWSAMPWQISVATLQPNSARITFSAIVALAEGVTCHHATECGSTCSRWAAPGRFHWGWKTLHVLPEPVPCRGYQKLWPVPEDAESAVRAQLESNHA